MPQEVEGRDGDDAAEMEEHQRLPANQQKLGERYGAHAPSQPSEGTDPANTRISDSCTPELRQISVI